MIASIPNVELQIRVEEKDFGNGVTVMVMVELLSTTVTGR